MRIYTRVKTVPLWQTVRWTLVCVSFTKRFRPDSPCPAERSHGDRWDCTECASASESYPEKHNIAWETWRNGRLKTTKHEALYGIRSYPLFHDIISMVGHFLHDAEGSCMDSKDKILAFLSMLDTNDRPVCVVFCLTLCVFIIFRVFWEVLQIIWKRAQRFQFIETVGQKQTVKKKKEWPSTHRCFLRSQMLCFNLWDKHQDISTLLITTKAWFTTVWWLRGLFIQGFRKGMFLCLWNKMVTTCFLSCHSTLWELNRMF